MRERSLSPCMSPFPVSTFSCARYFQLPAVQATDVQMLDSAIHQINHYPADKYYGNQLRYLLDSDLSGGQRYPTLEQPGTDEYGL